MCLWFSLLSDVWMFFGAADKISVLSFSCFAWNLIEGPNNEGITKANMSGDESGTNGARLRKTKLWQWFSPWHCPSPLASAFVANLTRKPLLCIAVTEHSAASVNYCRPAASRAVLHWLRSLFCLCVCEHVVTSCLCRFVHVSLGLCVRTQHK